MPEDYQIIQSQSVTSFEDACLISSELVTRMANIKIRRERIIIHGKGPLNLYDDNTLFEFIPAKE